MGFLSHGWYVFIAPPPGGCDFVGGHGAGDGRSAATGQVAFGDPLAIPVGEPGVDAEQELTLLVVLLVAEWCVGLDLVEVTGPEMQLALPVVDLGFSHSHLHIVDNYDLASVYSWQCRLSPRIVTKGRCHRNPLPIVE
ncbi:hypothetical protein [Bradyrhizobium sp. CCGB20]|uniref:hypothetical protein n=1 Tax=Bradyrhizobium sp. CCGB20 TaxID=2949633 RepID=UPI0020B2F8A2|nr:hypothetical protein [Bradyrhizobium sp. CCGB20]MCP3400432.1 hypothetical protein [Bradyrhizobium sp. CCGB20]